MDSKQLNLAITATESRLRVNGRQRLVSAARDLADRAMGEISAAELASIDSICTTAGSSRKELLELVAIIYRSRQLEGMIAATEAACPPTKRSELERRRDKLARDLEMAQAGDIGQIKEEFNATCDEIRGCKDVEQTLAGRRVALDELKNQHAELLSV